MVNSDVENKVFVTFSCLKLLCFCLCIKTIFCHGFDRNAEN